MLFALAAPAGAVEVELGLRFEWLNLEQPLDFTCDAQCDEEEDPGCHRTPAEDLCVDQSTDEPHDGWLLGVLAGVHTGGPVWSIGGRLVGTMGPFAPTSEADGRTTQGATAEDEALLLGHVTVEVPVEIRFGGPGVQVYFQVVPRLGLLNLLGGRSEDADTFTAGVLGVAGLRFGGESGAVQVAGGRVQHPSFGGWALDAAYLIRAVDEHSVEGEPPPEVEVPAEEAESPIDEEAPAGGADAPEASDDPATP